MFCLTGFSGSSSYNQASSLYRRSCVRALQEIQCRSVLEEKPGKVQVVREEREPICVMLPSKGRLDFTNLQEKNKHFPSFPIHTWSYETRVHFSKIKRRHILEIANFEVFIDGN